MKIFYVIATLLIASTSLASFVKSQIGSMQTSIGEVNRPEESIVKYLESDSNQYITTGFRIKSGYTLIGKIGYRPSGTSTLEIPVSGGYYYSGSYYNISIVAKYGVNLAVRTRYPSSNGATSSYFETDVPIGTMRMLDFEIGPEGSFCNGECFSSVPFAVADGYPIYVGLFCDGNNKPYGLRWKYQYPSAIGRIAMFDETGEAVFDMIPYRFKNEDGIDEGAFYDMISGELYRNQGTGSFVIGPDIE